MTASPWQLKSNFLKLVNVLGAWIAETRDEIRFIDQIRRSNVFYLSNEQKREFDANVNTQKNSNAFTELAENSKEALVKKTKAKHQSNPKLPTASMTTNTLPIAPRTIVASEHP